MPLSRVVDTASKTDPKFRAFVDDHYVHNSPDSGIDQYRANRMSGPRNRLIHHMGAVKAGLTEAANLRTALVAGLEPMEVVAQGAQEPGIWGDEPMTFTGTDGELGPNMTLGGMRAATMFRVAAQIETTVQPGRVKMLNDLYRRVSLDDYRGIYEMAKWILSRRTGRALSGSTTQAVAEYLGHLEMVLDMVD